MCPCAQRPIEAANEIPSRHFRQVSAQHQCNVFVINLPFAALFDGPLLLFQFFYKKKTTAGDAATFDQLILIFLFLGSKK